jgi:hypothetical protein
MPAVFLVWRGVPDEHGLFWATLDHRGNAFHDPIPDRGSADRPALAAYRDRLIMAWRGVPDDERLFWATAALRRGAAQWSPQRVVPMGNSAVAPALAVYHNRLFMVWRGAEDDGRFFWTTFDDVAQDWFAPPTNSNTIASIASPTVAVLGDRMYMAYRGGEHKIAWAIYDETGNDWLPQDALPDAESESEPALVAFQDRLFLFWSAEESQALMFATFDGRSTAWTPAAPLDPPLFSFRPPALAVYRQELNVFFMGTLSEHGGTEPPPDILDTQLRFVPFNGRRRGRVNFLPATSATSPAAVVFPTPTRFLRDYLLAHGFDPQEGFAQVGRGSVRDLLDL